MADFKTHLLGGALLSGTAAAALAMGQAVGSEAAFGYFTLGVLGGLLPDIDAEGSLPMRIAYRVIGTLAAMSLVLSAANHYSLLELVLLGIASYAFVRFLVFGAFNRLTVHRGLIHSIPAAFCAAAFTAIVTAYLFKATPVEAWLCGAFVGSGYLVHLLLDEVYSIDLLGQRVKRSFGSALSFGDLDNPTGTAALYVALVLLLIVSPSWDGAFNLLFDGELAEQLNKRLLPRGFWFIG